MTHVPEYSFHDSVESFLKEEFPDAQLEHEVYLENSGRYADFVLRKGQLILSIEVENDFESVFKAVGQSVLYAMETGGYPVVIVPQGHTEYPEWELVQRLVIGMEVEHIQK